MPRPQQLRCCLERLRNAALAYGLTALAVLSAVRCGHDEKKDGDGGGAGSPPSAAVPAGWDGKSDWSGSAWEVVDE